MQESSNFKLPVPAFSVIPRVLVPAELEVAFGGAACPGTDDSAVPRHGVFDVAVENEMIDPSGLVLGVHLKVNQERRRDRESAALARRSELYIEFGHFEWNRVGAGVDGPAGV